MPHPTMDVFLCLIFNFYLFLFLRGRPGGFLCYNKIPNCIELERSVFLTLAYECGDLPHNDTD